MDNYSDVNDRYVASLEKLILDAGLKLPSIYGFAMTARELREHQRQVRAIRYQDNKS